jgi:hypothetical protein
MDISNNRRTLPPPDFALYEACFAEVTSAFEGFPEV